MVMEQLPANPYTTQPIKRRDRLAGRRQELEKIQYYLRLTGNGEDSYLLALIGERGVGKTSLLNAAQVETQDLGLLPVRIDLDENTVRTAGHFWKEVYTALVEAAADVGCWGGRGTIYQALFLMLQAGTPAPDPAFVVLKFPLVIAANSGRLETISCSSTLLARDLTDTLAELRHVGRKGFVLLIDEADLLGSNRPLIQSVRNIFQALTGCALLVAGTDAVFPVITEVFSPIPRQFHKLEVNAFGSEDQTRDLITKPFANPPYDQWKKLIPADGIIKELHELCGGNPKELQLYCHHMYQQAETRTLAGKEPRMALEPQVFREVLKAYRATTPLDMGDILGLIEQLPDALLFNSPWLRRRHLTCAENIRCDLLQRALKAGRLLTSDEEARAETEIRQSYQDLFERGLLESPDRFHQKGAPATYGFWKSFVAVEKNRRWSWNDDLADQVVTGLVLMDLVRGTKASTYDWPDPEEPNFLDALAGFRTGQPVGKVSTPAFFKFSMLTIEGRKEGLSEMVRLGLAIGYRGKTRVAQLDYLAVEPANSILQRAEEWCSARQELLTASGLQVSLTDCFSSQLLSNEEFQRISNATSIVIRFKGEPFGPFLRDQAINAFNEGRVDDAAHIFQRMVLDAGHIDARNNLGYCLACLGRFEEARNVFSHTLPDNDNLMWPLWEHNRAVVAALCGNAAIAVSILEQLRAWIEKRGEGFAEQDRGYLCMMVLRTDLRGVDSNPRLPLLAATLINLAALGRIDPGAARQLLAERYPTAYEPWLALLPAAERDQKESI